MNDCTCNDRDRIDRVVIPGLPPEAGTGRRISPRNRRLATPGRGIRGRVLWGGSVLAVTLAGAAERWYWRGNRTDGPDPHVDGRRRHPGRDATWSTQAASKAVFRNDRGR